MIYKAISYDLRYRCCQRFGHKEMPCIRCGVHTSHPTMWDYINAMINEKMGSYLIEESPMLMYVKRAPR